MPVSHPIRFTTFARQIFDINSCFDITFHQSFPVTIWRKPIVFFFNLRLVGQPKAGEFQAAALLHGQQQRDICSGCGCMPGISASVAPAMLHSAPIREHVAMRSLPEAPRNELPPFAQRVGRRVKKQHQIIEPFRCACFLLGGGGPRSA